MEDQDTYYSIAAASIGLYREKASKFKAFAFPVSSEADIRTQIDSIRKSYFDANHFCYAYRIGFPAFIYRVNDDGEPSGSAGKPIYGQILSRDLYDILVVVIRYFGGTKLGIPGLIRAYRSATAEALDAAETVIKIVTERRVITFPYERMNEVMRIIKQEFAQVVAQESDLQVTLHLEVRKTNSENLIQRLNQIMNVCVIH